MSYIYVVGRPAGPVKVGVTNSIKTRLKSLQTGCPFPLEFVFYHVCKSRAHAERLERIFHQNFDRERLCGEWFQLDAETAVGCLQV